MVMQSIPPRGENENTMQHVEDDIEIMVETYSDQLFRLCFTILRNRADAEDAVSETMIKYLTRTPIFLEEEHRKAWLIRVAVNVCRDLLRTGRHRQHFDLEEVRNAASSQTDSTILADLLQLPEQYRTVLYLYYIEGYRSGEIAEMLSISPSAVRKRLQNGRKKLKLEYERDH